MRLNQMKILYSDKPRRIYKFRKRHQKKLHPAPMKIIQEILTERSFPKKTAQNSSLIIF